MESCTLWWKTIRIQPESLIVSSTDFLMSWTLSPGQTQSSSWITQASTSHGSSVIWLKEGVHSIMYGGFVLLMTTQRNEAPVFTDVLSRSKSNRRGLLLYQGLDQGKSWLRSLRASSRWPQVFHPPLFCYLGGRIHSRFTWEGGGLV